MIAKNNTLSLYRKAMLLKDTSKRNLHLVAKRQAFFFYLSLSTVASATDAYIQKLTICLQHSMKQGLA